VPLLVKLLVSSVKGKIMYTQAYGLCVCVSLVTCHVLSIDVRGKYGALEG